MGFSSTPKSLSNQYSWEVKKQQPNPRSKQEQKKIDNVTKKLKDNAAKVKAQQSDWDKKGVRTQGLAKGKSDFANYGFALPRYTAPQRARRDYKAGDNFDPKQTLFRHDPGTFNVKKMQEYCREGNKRGKTFIPPHSKAGQVYQGFLNRTGVSTLARAWSSQSHNEVGGHLFDKRGFAAKFGQPPESKLSANQGYAVRQWLAIPGNAPDRVSNVSPGQWSGSPDPRRQVDISKTLGGGEQIIGIPEFFKFNKK